MSLEIKINSRPVNYREENRTKEIYVGYIYDPRKFTIFFNCVFNTQLNDLTGNVLETINFTDIKLNALDLEINTTIVDSISMFPEITNDLFKDVLSPYGIQLNSVEVHAYDDIETKDFVFVDNNKKQILMDLIKDTFKKNLI